MSLAKSSVDTSPSREEVYQALLRSLARRKGFGIVFVQGYSAETNRVIQRVQEDLPRKQIAVLKLDKPIENLYDLIKNRPDRDNLNILFVQGLEESLKPYVKPGYGGEGDYYNVDTVPSILSHLNQRRELFRDHFKNICFVFILPTFAVKYIIRRAPDFFDWSAGVFDFSSDTDPQVVQGSNIQANSGRDQIVINFSGDRSVAIGGNVQGNFIITGNNNLVLAPKIRADFSKEKADELFMQSRYREALNSYQEALELYQEIENQTGKANTLKAMGDLLQFLKQSQEALERYKTAIGIYRQVGDQLGEANALKAIGDVLQFLDQRQAALERYEMAIAIYRQVGDRLGEANALQAIGDVLQFLKQSPTALERYETAIAIYRQVGDRLGEANTLKAIGDLLQFLDQRRAALERYETAIAIYRQVGDRLGEANTLKSLGDIFAARVLGEKASDIEQIIACYQQALEIFRQIGDRYSQAIALDAFGNVLQNLKQYEQALSYYDRAISLYQSIELDKNFYSQILLNRGNALKALGQLKEAINSYDKAVLIEPTLYEAWFERGGALNQLGQLKEAIDNYDKALDIKPDLCEALMYKASSYSWLKNTKLALANLERAIELDPHNVREWAKTNSAFKALQRDKRFQELIWDDANAENRIEQNNYSQWLRGLTSRWSGRFKDPGDDA